MFELRTDVSFDVGDYIVTPYPRTTCKGHGLVEDILAVLVGTSQLRCGPGPGVETAGALRALVAAHVAQGAPIPILVPSGPKKPKHGATVDMAELSALKVLAGLHQQVSDLYPPSLEMALRLEDVTGWVLEGAVARGSIRRYLADMEALVATLGMDYLHPVRESGMTTEAAFRTEVDVLEPLLLAYLRETDAWERDDCDTYRALCAAGWRGTIPKEQRMFYRERYQRLYPQLSWDQATALMARYFATTLARVRLGASGALAHWDQCVQLNFAPPVPGAPRMGTRLYYRTAPVAHTKRHIPFWRARGYLHVAGGSVRMGLASWQEELSLRPMVLSLTRGPHVVHLEASYAEAR